MTPRERDAGHPKDSGRSLGHPFEDAFLRAPAAALSHRAVPGARIAEEQVEYDVLRAAAWPPRSLRPLLREAREALDRADPARTGPGSESAAEALERLARAFPVVAADQVDDAAAEFRRLLLEALEQAGRSSPGQTQRPPAIRLAPPLPSQRPQGEAPSS